jgi:hypothetical protein
LAPAEHLAPAKNLALAIHTGAGIPEGRFYAETLSCKFIAPNSSELEIELE